MDRDSFKKYANLTTLCRNIAENPFDNNLLAQLKSNIESSPKSFVRAAQKPLITSFYPYIENAAKNKTSIPSRVKQLLVETLDELVKKLVIEHTNVFFNFYTFLLLELYDYGEHKVLPNSEEYKLAVLNCVTSLINSVSLDILEELYVKDNIPKFSQIVYVCSELAKNDAARNIRSSAITCIMALARVLNTDDLNDIVLRDKCADVFMFFLPGLSSTFPAVALEDVKIGHSVPVLAIRAYGRIISLVMHDYNPSSVQTLDFKEMLRATKNVASKGKFNGKEDIDQYLDSTIRNSRWYEMTDEKLNLSLKKMGSLTYHSHPKIRLAMVEMAGTIVRSCEATMPLSICTLIEHLIILSQDTEPEIAEQSETVLRELSGKLSEDCLSSLFESLEDGFYNAISSLPRKFNSIDDNEKVATLNLLVGYIKLFGQHNLNVVLLSPNMLNNLLQGLLHVAQLEKTNISVLEEYTLKDLSSELNFRCPWINFHYFKETAVKDRLDLLCRELAQTCFEAVYDTLLDTFLYEPERKKEAVYLINSHISGLDGLSDQYKLILKNILNTYAEQSLIAPHPEDYSLDQTQDNIIVTCLLTDGIGRISLILKDDFKPFLLKVLYLVLEKAGSGHPLIRTSGLLALHNITGSCGHKNVADLVNCNFDFLSYHVQKNLSKLEDKEGVLNVLSVVLRYSNVDVLLPMKHVVEDALVESCDRFKEKHATAYLKVFKMFIASLRKWFQIEAVAEKVKTRSEKDMEHENFKVTGAAFSNNDFSDDVMEGKSAEEMFREDMARGAEEEPEFNDQGYQKPSPPMHVELTSLILKRSLHFLPSKRQSRSLLALEILESGLEILRDWEDELLPVVHQIWSPLVQRFKKDKDPLIMRMSISLVATLARLSKDFIRMRVVKELLPNLKDVLKESAQASYLKDKGSTYRYSQSYKLQRELLSSIGPILYNLDVEGHVIGDVVDCVHFYLSDKQPMELQVAAIEFFKMMYTFDAEAVQEKIAQLRVVSEDYSENLDRLHQFMENCKY